MNPPPPGSISVLIVDDHRLFREGLVRLLELESDIAQVVGCASIEEALAILDRQPIDIVLLDFDLGNQNGFAFFDDLRQAPFRGKVLVVTAGVSPADASAMMKQGAAGVFLKHNSPELLLAAIRRVMAGEVCLDEQYSDLAAEDGSQPPRRTAFTERDRQVLRAVFEGLGNKEIGRRLGVSESAIKASLQQLFSKTGVRTRAQLVRIAVERYRGLL